MREQVVVTGLGAVSPYGVGVPRLIAGLYAGEPTATKVTRFDADAHPARIACEVPNFVPGEWLPRKLVSQLDPFAQYGVVAAEEALTQAGLLAPRDAAGQPSAALPLADGIDADRVATLITSSAGGISEMLTQHARLLTGGPRRVRPFFAIAMPINLVSGQVAIRHGLRGPSFSVVSACASATDSIGVGLDLIRAGRADVVVAGGAEATINPLTMAAFGIVGALSKRNDDPAAASRPFDRDRDGFVMGEGAGVVVFERAAHAAARGAVPLAELAGYGISNDAYHPSGPHPDADGAIRALRLALADADLAPSDVDHVNAHGTSTPANDRTEAMAVRAVLGPHADRTSVTSTKSAVGHLLGAAGAVESIATIEAVRRQEIAPTLNLDHQDPDCPLDVVHGGPRATAVRVACSNSFGFGGHNGVLVYRGL
ncbi:beta-ketoacyl-ACP synthase II [Cryptosporangium aurantiacum]|uniref:3-oxoacyl-[acyl-carrier-protein] synthase 2 n=1 Tax=Cryptosporangium aurantiacum TaxID=134849 RepID=A0A1M7RMA0_9ACTN|nr:beta-ketoacyl-ACP synthase II [Cryptosporangium aurantiacum]SHN47311.1 3-oxoacyl-[acyl-carrier-protein] synthase II [Cryptosporangium aurantiacum]